MEGLDMADIIPSLTYWSRLEPRPRSYSLEEGLSARIRDPLWMLARQWQMGEFQGEDAGSPSHVEITARTSKILGPMKGGDAPEGIKIKERPLEVLVEDEAFTPDLSIKVELGQTFEALLSQKLTEAKVSVSRIKKISEAFRAEYPIKLPSEDELSKMVDHEAVRFLRVCAGRALDGIALYKEAASALPSMPSRPSIDPKYKAPVKAALEELVLWVHEVFRDLSLDDPSDWKPERLEYGSNVAAARGDAGQVTLSAEPDSSGDLDWYAFDLDEEIPVGTPPSGSVSTFSTNVVPAHVKFRGMPNPRWWDFERWTTDFGDIRPDKLDIARLVVMEFMLVHGVDWFMMPMEQEVGTLCKVENLVVKDVFGGLTQIKRTDEQAVAGNSSWTLFSTSHKGEKSKVADFFVLSPSVSVAKKTGPVIEDIRFLRDETANMSWAVEHTTEDGLGQPWLGYERNQAIASSKPQNEVNKPDPSVPLTYQIQTPVPENWIPFIPMSIDAQKGRFMLQESAMLDVDEGELKPIEPLGRILQPANLPAGQEIYRIFEEEVPRAGARVYRERCRSRWIDGSTHIWINRRMAAGTGEGSSGLKFDLAI
jgi:hypothetical protein